mgnify:FL=1|jgi:hypothetical protein|tara:strand:+ start:555 stop:827 length:273 start_codon:yes stop_codon:yes gene_type:complete
MAKPIICKIKKKKYYLCKITWIDITGDEGHATIDQFDKMNYCKLITYGFVYYNDSKVLKTFSTYDSEEEIFSGRNVFPKGCVKKIEKILV